MSERIPSNPCNVPEILRSIVREGNAWPSAGIIGEAANLLDDTDALLGRLAECFGDDETEFADIKLIRDRIAAIDTRGRHNATDDSARRHAPETDEDLPGESEPIEQIRARDAASAATWFKEPAVGACGQAFIDRRYLLSELARLQRLVDNAVMTVRPFKCQCGSADTGIGCRCVDRPSLKASGDPYVATCQGGSGGKCCDPDCEKCWPDPPAESENAS